ncbi:FAD/NAD(P)-binding domain-containing protein [Mytilinidion resinicola]|uniref:FAD/NAD(P)-binding domain-containing protein n=1 Tax=Mytilinidion resinicola TaxID=574789 RepID=A0A6A6Z9F0_9PEZI|nr:FAD/NAD(P)-binding domain-containing protein [Mytilinidion resinicola]KAF2817751.1 FAD/NAD(P)-binding domain-containing protein [Mytilinidion resinicola]
MPIKHIIIIGGGIAGVASALALIRLNKISCSVFEIRSEPTTIGGAINLTPNALRYLDYLRVLPRLLRKGCEVYHIDVISQRTGANLGRIDFDKVEKFKHRALRILRADLLEALLEELEESGVKVQYSKRIESVLERDDGVEATFDDGTTVVGDMLLGCDGIHSSVRMNFVQPERKPVYTGIAVTYGFLSAGGLSELLPFDSTAAIFGRFGTFLMSFYTVDKSQLYISVVTETKDVGSREGCLVKGSDQDALKDDILRRFAGSAMPCLETGMQKVDSWVLYPVFKLPPHGVWHSGRLLLLGDAAHAMPPQGESVGLVLEDVVFFSRLVSHHKGKAVSRIFQGYDSLRRARIDAVYKEATFRWETARDRGWLMTVIMEWMMWIFIRLMAGTKERDFQFDVRDIELPN